MFTNFSEPEEVDGIVFRDLPQQLKAWYRFVSKYLGDRGVDNTDEYLLHLRRLFEGLVFDACRVALKTSIESAFGREINAWEMLNRTIPINRGNKYKHEKGTATISMDRVFFFLAASGLIPHAAISETSSNCWNLRVISVFI